MIELKTILLAEDSPMDVELILEALADHNLANLVVVVSDGVEAMEYLRCAGAYADRDPCDRPAVMLLDLKMPRMDGLKVLREVRADPDLRLLPIVVLTSSREERDLQNAYSLGANAYVVKPVDFSDFVDAVAEVGVFWGLINEQPPGGVRHDG